MEIEGVEQQIFLQPEMAIVGAVYSVNGYTGHVVLTTSDLENTSGYQTSTDVANLISAHNTSEEAHPYIQALISAKQDPIVAGNGISITGGNTVAIDTTVVATQQNLATEVTNRENADIALQGQIDAMSASSDVVDIVGTYAELQNYDTSTLGDNDIIKVLQDSTQGNATTYYRWSTTTQTFTLIGQEGPYYTKAGADAQFVPQTRTINSKPLSANITLTASDVSALGQSDIVQTTGTSTTQVMSQNAVTTALATKLDASSVPDGFFDGEATVSTAGTSLEIEGAIKVKSVEIQGDTQQQTYTGKNLISSDRTLGAPSDTSWGNATKRTFDTGTYVVGLSRNNYYSPNNVTVSKNAGAFTVTSTQNYYGMNLPIDVDPNNTYCLSYNVTNSSYSYSGVGFYAQDGTFLSDKILSNGGNFQPPAGTKTAVILLGLIEANETCVYSDIQLEIGSTATAYEPYVGGVPSPSPDYPQTVSVVTGTQTVTVTDNDSNSQTYTIDLGSIELCKIGDYQDYIYKSGDDWYVHKDIGKVVLDGSETWGVFPSQNRICFYTNIANGIGNTGYSNNYGFRIDISTGGYPESGSIFYNGNGNKNMLFRQNDDSIITTVDAYKTWLSAHNTTVYYALATATDTKITDSTLTGQLDALLSAQMYPEYTVISSNGNLPAILDITAYNSNLNGIIEVLASTVSTLGNINSALNIINNGGN